MLRRYSYILSLLLALAPAFQIATVNAAETAVEIKDFREHYERAMKYYDQGEYQDSIKEFQKAYALRQLPRLLLNLGQIHRKLGRAREALGYYEMYLRVEPNPDVKLKIELDQYIVQTRAMLEAAGRLKKESEEASQQTAQERGLEDATQPRRPLQPVPPTPLKTAAKQMQPKAEGEPEKLVPSEVAHPMNSAPPPAQRSKVPVHKKWWLWTLVGVAAAGTAAGIAGGVVASRDGPPESPLGTARVFMLYAIP